MMIFPIKPAGQTGRGGRRVSPRPDGQGARIAKTRDKSRKLPRNAGADAVLGVIRLQRLTGYVNNQPR